MGGRGIRQGGDGQATEDRRHPRAWRDRGRDGSHPAQAALRERHRPGRGRSYLSAAEWLRFLYEHPRAMHTQLVTMDERLDQAMLKIVESYLAIAQGVAKALVELVDSGVGTRGQDGVVLCFSQQDLATLTG